MPKYILNQNRNKASTFTKDGYSFDSKEEVEFYIFLRDCTRVGLIKKYEYQPKAYELIPKAVEVIKVPYKRKEGFKTVEKVLYPSHKYTIDFKFLPSPRLYELIPSICRVLRVSKDNWIYTDIKGAYNRFGGDRLFNLHRCMMFNKFRVHVNKIVPELFFKQIGVAPEELRWMQSRKVPTLKKAYIGLESLDNLVKNGHKFKKVYNEINIPFLLKK